ncbi:hypothetical protein [Enterococcus sp. AZ109]|uniref:hypothetical protein n=1 Tax=Enterococcus sp. AZ109 TaxID=2774634 RepID=UPI003F2459E9
MCYHANNDEMLYPDLVKLFYPYPYRTNVIETLHLLKQEGYWTDSRTEMAKQLILSKRKNKGYMPEKIFMKSSWYPFDQLKQCGPWLTDEIERLFAETFLY